MAIYDPTDDDLQERMAGITILSGHVSPETAYHVLDYPYGFKLRCQIRYWLEFNKTHGFRFVSQTSNPKRGGVWNKPKASTYCRFGGCMFLNEEGHVKWSGLTEYSTAAEAEAWASTYGDGVPEAGKPVLTGWIKMKQAYEKARDAKVADRIDGFDRDDLGESPDY